MENQDATIYLRDYRPHPYRIRFTSMELDLDTRLTRVRTVHDVERRSKTPEPLVLDCDSIDVESVRIDGREPEEGLVTREGKKLIIDGLPEACQVEIVNTLDPSANTQLSGLYQSGSMLCTQCEAEGFRRITPSIDRPDNLATYRVILRGPSNLYPVLLCNGNLVRQEVDNGVHMTEWHDPFPKPTYLFAIVAGNLSCLKDRFRTRGGRDVELNFYAVDRDIHKCQFAMGALKRAMRWDEETYGREYDLDLYNVVAVEDFNMGAMENKSLNIFNTRYVLANPDVATDSAYHDVEKVIAHEYFHNWSGNRVTCRDWFQLSLKEGFTVFREQCFGADMTSPGVTRIDDADGLRNRQFPEDAGPLAHPVRPESYQEINNFYTATVYEKGAEVVRMLQVLTGPEAFRRGTDLYFDRHDGKAVTTDDFVASIEEAVGDEAEFDFTAFKRWYSQAGTPEVSAEGKYDRSADRYSLNLRQHCPATPGQADKLPFVIPVVVSLLDSAGSPMPFADGSNEQVLVLSDPEQQFVFENIPRKPVPSLLRRFSAPVKLKTGLDSADLGTIARHDDDPFNRWEAGQRLFGQAILDNLERVRAGEADRFDDGIIDLAGELAKSPEDDLMLTARLITLPGEAWLGELSKPIDPQGLSASRLALIRCIAAAHHEAILDRYLSLQEANDGSMGAAQCGIRALRDACLTLLASLDTDEVQELARTQLQQARNLTDRNSALSAITHSSMPDRQALLDGYYRTWQDEALVVNMWLRVQATARHADVLAQVRNLTAHPAFDHGNPNKIYALLVAFARLNPSGFHRDDGAGYAFTADWVQKLDQTNPQVAATLAGSLASWRDMLPELGAQMKSALERISESGPLSTDVAELVSLSLKSG